MKPEYLQNIPEGWEVKKLNQCFKIIGSGTTPQSGTNDYYVDGTIPWLNTTDLNDYYLNDCPKKITKYAFDTHSALKIYPKNSIAVAMYGATIAKMSYLNFETTTNQASCILSESNCLNLKFAFYSLLSLKNYIISLSYGGGQPNISQETIRNLKLPVPSIEIQTKISDFLDTKTAAIEKIISARQKKLELLKELKAATINQIMNNDKWEKKKLKFVCQMNYGNSLSEEKREIGNIPVYGSNGIVGNHSIAITTKPCIIIGRKGSYGKINFSEIECFPIDTTYYIDTNSTNENIYWLNYALQTLELDENTRDTGVPGLSREFAYNKYVTVPPLPEQAKIVEIIKSKHEKLDKAISNVAKEIAAWKEYRTRLISDAVFGKLSVSEFSEFENKQN